MKFLYEFELVEKITVKEPELQKIDGKDVEVLVAKINNEVRRFAIKKPSRSLRDESELFFSVTRAGYIRAGMLTITETRKRLLNDGGALSESEKDRLKKAWENYLKDLKEYREITLIDADKRTEQNKTRLFELEKSSKANEETIKEFEMAEFVLFEDTADARARNKAIFWWVLNLAHEIKDGKPVPVFGEGTYEEKMKVYETQEEDENKFALEVVTKFNQLLSMWYAGKASTKEDFDGVLEFYRNAGTV